ncbi:MAG: alpha/beta hydrolase [Candidatus Dojkabacteria bacterium]|nr:alpha/beta hydrolase [Candidatus Dojkabacteria bacterium]
MIKRIKSKLPSIWKDTPKEFLEMYSVSKVKTISKERCEVEINYATSLNFSKDRKTILFLHGLSNNWLSWIPVAKLLEEEYNVVLMDMPGFGESSRLDKYNIEIISNTVADFISALALKIDTVTGLCAGAVITFDLAMNHPEIADKFIPFAMPTAYFNNYPLVNKTVLTLLYTMSNVSLCR